jgi:hypothetical protein
MESIGDTMGEEFESQITLRWKALKTQGKIAWPAVRDDFRNWLIRAA